MATRQSNILPPRRWGRSTRAIPLSARPSSKVWRAGEIHCKQSAKPLVKAAAAGGEWEVRDSAIAALSAINPKDPEQLKTTLGTLVNQAASGDPPVQYFAAEALGAINPSDPAQRKTVVKGLARGRDPLQAKREAKATQVERGAGVLEGAAKRVAQEWDRTLAWLRGWIGGADDRRCWRGNDRNTLTQLRDDFGKVDGFGAEARALDENIAADGATPIFGQSILAAGAWALVWTAFLVVFPYSARVRGIYLYNEKMASISCSRRPRIATSRSAFISGWSVMPPRPATIDSATNLCDFSIRGRSSMQRRKREGRPNREGSAIREYS